MFPRLSIEDVVNSRALYAVFFCKLIAVQSRCLDVVDGFISKFCNVLLLLTACCIRSTFLPHVFVIVCMRAKEKVIRIYAKAIVAPVQYAQPFWNRAFVQLVGDTVRALNDAFKRKSVCPVIWPGKFPLPATVCGYQIFLRESLKRRFFVRAACIKVLSSFAPNVVFVAKAGRVVGI